MMIETRKMEDAWFLLLRLLVDEDCSGGMMESGESAEGSGQFWYSGDLSHVFW